MGEALTSCKAPKKVLEQNFSQKSHNIITIEFDIMCVHMRIDNKYFPQAYIWKQIDEACRLRDHHFFFAFGPF